MRYSMTRFDEKKIDRNLRAKIRHYEFWPQKITFSRRFSVAPHLISFCTYWRYSMQSFTLIHNLNNMATIYPFRNSVRLIHKVANKIYHGIYDIIQGENLCLLPVTECLVTLYMPIITFILERYAENIVFQVKALSLD